MNIINKLENTLDSLGIFVISSDKTNQDEILKYTKDNFNKTFLSSPQEASEIYEAQKYSINLIIFDTKCDINTIQELLKNHSEIRTLVPIIFITYEDTTIAELDYLDFTLNLTYPIKFSKLKSVINFALANTLKEKCIQSFIIQKEQYELAKSELEINTNIIEAQKRSIEKGLEKFSLLNAELADQVKEEVQKSNEKDNQLIQQSKMSEMGEMIASIIHQWKQPLNAVMLSTTDLQFDISLGDFDEDRVNETLHEVEEQVKHMVETMDNFRDFLKPAKKQTYKISDSIERILNILKGIYKSKGIDIIIDDLQDIEILGYPSHIEQVIINILNNARDAILENNPENYSINIRASKSNEYLNIYISDLAGGIDEGIIDKIFEPYFTTKPADKGTGIGLHMSKNIIQKDGGELEVANYEQDIDGNIFKGARFIIRIPLEFDEDCD
jgi:signal transduction histidine kinase